MANTTRFIPSEATPDDLFRRNGPYIAEPMLTTDLEDTANDPNADWSARMLETLASQLGVENDYYYPLKDAASELRHNRAALRVVNEGNPEKGYGGRID